ncbi:MAG: tRNA (N(6)-L-threonylcarbamoyladenosine(37)-C(2))-methylthiotransferase MtaB [Alloprevotella sp.]
MYDISEVLGGKRLTFLTLGCKLNFAETSSVRDRLLALGAVEAGKDDEADLLLVNTCSVTEVADHKCRQAIHRLHRRHPGAAVVVMGCYAQLQPEQIAAIEGVDLVIGTEQKGQVVELIAECLALKAGAGCSQAAGRVVCTAGRDIKSFAPSCSRGERTRCFLKVQDGCNYYCTYCTIPMARGRSRNGSVASLTAQACEAARLGAREIVITGVNIGDFGRSTGETFLELIRSLDAVEGIDRYRISSIEPNLLTTDVIRFCAESRSFMPHFHIPLQSGSDEVLRLMHRRYDTSFFRSKVQEVLEYLPDAFLGIDVIVGMRGETAELFEETFSFLEALPFAELHVFSYSERPGTRALDIPHTVPPADKHERSARLLALSERKRRDFYARFAGSRRPVLWEHPRPGQPLRGFTDNYIRVELPAGTSAQPADGSIQECRLGDFTPDAQCLLAIPL